MNKKRIIITLVCMVFVLATFFLFNTHVEFVQGETSINLVKETDTEFDLEHDANLRNMPVYSSKIKSTIAKGTHVRVLQELNRWVQITDGTNTGWVVKQNIVTIETIPNEPVTNPEPTNATSNQANNVSNEIENKPLTNTVEVPNNTPTTNVGKKGVINVDTAKVRETPNGTVIGLVDLNDSVEILVEEGDWYKANIDEYKNCYIAKRLVTIK